MKLFCLVIAIALASIRLNAQASITNQITTHADCYGTCDGVISFTVSNATPPYSVTINNPSNCTNPMLYTATSNTFSIGNMCPCQGLYTFAFYDNTGFIGNSYNYFQTTATQPLNVSVGNIMATSCATCCTGTANMLSTGGSTQQGPVYFWLDGVYLSFNFYPAYGICAGTHTVCGKDNYGCERCTTFVMPVNSVTGMEELSNNSHLQLWPNPCTGVFSINADYYKTEPAEVIISSILGKELRTFTISDLSQKQVQFSISDLSKGIYMVSLRKEGGDIIARSSLILN